MKTPRFAERLAAAAGKGLPGGLLRDGRENVQAALRAALARLDLVTREEFEVQQGVLRRTRERLQALEEQLARLEESTARSARD